MIVQEPAQRQCCSSGQEGGQQVEGGHSPLLHSSHGSTFEPLFEVSTWILTCVCRAGAGSAAPVGGGGQEPARRVHTGAGAEPGAGNPPGAVPPRRSCCNPAVVRAGPCLLLPRGQWSMTVSTSQSRGGLAAACTLPAACSEVEERRQDPAFVHPPQPLPRGRSSPVLLLSPCCLRRKQKPTKPQSSHPCSHRLVPREAASLEMGRKTISGHSAVEN